jgi:hypothetical protein
MKVRSGAVLAVALVLTVSVLVTVRPHISSAATTLSGTPEFGVNVNGEGYGLLSLTSPADVTTIRVTMAAGTDYVVIFTADSTVDTKPLPYEDTPPWRLVGSATYTASPVTFTVSPARTTRYVLALTRRTGAPASAPSAIGADGTALPPPSTTTTVPSGNGTPAAQCHDLGDGAVDQNGISVDRWAPGLRKACGQFGYENGDNPMPRGTPLPAPRPFRFDYAVDHNEAVHGFKVFYWNGDSRHCGDMRLIIHQGGAVHGFMTRFHTAQFAMALCDSAGRKRIIDVGGQIDTGSLQLESTSEIATAGEVKLTADIASCSGRPGSTSGGCETTWYATLFFDVPGRGTAGVNVEFTVQHPITLADPNDLTAVIITNSRGVAGWNGAPRILGNWLVFNLWSGSRSTWWTTFDSATGKQVVVPAETPGAWQMRVDGGIASRADGALVANCVLDFPCDRRTHDTGVAGIVYPN